MVRQLSGPREPGARPEAERPAAGVAFETVRLDGERAGRRGARAPLIAVAWLVALGGLVVAGVANRKPDAPIVANATATAPPVAVATPAASRRAVAGGPPYGRENRFEPAGADRLLLRVQPVGGVVQVHGDPEQRRVIQLVVWVEGDAGLLVDPRSDRIATASAGVTVRTGTSFDVVLPLPTGVPYRDMYVEANTFDEAGDLLSRSRARLSTTDAYR